MSPPPGDASSSKALSVRVSRTLYGSLETTLTKAFAERYDTGLLLQCTKLEHVETSPNDVANMKVQVHCRGLVNVRARLLVTCLDGGDYDILCNVEEGQIHRFSYHLPGDASPSRRQLVPLAQDVATFLRHEVENRLGRLLLQSPTRPPNEAQQSLLS